MSFLNSTLAKWLGIGLIGASSVVGVTYNHYRSSVKKEYREVVVERVLDNGRVARNTRLKIKGPEEARRGETVFCEVEYNADLPLDHSTLIVGIDYSVGDILEDQIVSYKKMRTASSPENTSAMTGYSGAGKTEWVPSEQKRAPSELMKRLLPLVPGYKELTGIVVRAGEFVGEFEKFTGELDKFLGTPDEATLVLRNAPEWVKGDDVEIVGPIKTGLTLGSGSVYRNYEQNLWRIPIRISDNATDNGKFHAYVYCDGGISGEFEIGLKDFPPAKKPDDIVNKKPRKSTPENANREVIAQKTLDNGRVARNISLKIIGPKEEFNEGRVSLFKIEYNADLPLDHSTLIAGIDYSVGDILEDKIVSYKKMRTANSSENTSIMTGYAIAENPSDWVPSEQKRAPSELMDRLLPLVPGYKELTGSVKQAGEFVGEFEKFTGELDKFLGTPDEATLVLRNAPQWVISDSVEVIGPIKTGLTFGSGSVYRNYEQNLWEIPVRIAESAGRGKFYAYVYCDGGISDEFEINIEGENENFSEETPKRDTVFGRPSIYLAGTDSVMAVVSDLNHDGKPDIVVPGDLPHGLVILLNDGSSGFQKRKSYDIGRSNFASVGDINRDNHPDIAITYWSSPNLSVLFGDGEGSFGSEKCLTLRGIHRSTAMADFNKDGFLDIVTDGDDSNLVYVILGDGRGGFGEPKSFIVGSSPVHITSADFNMDSNPDILIANAKSADISILLGNGRGNFSAKRDFPAGDNPVMVLSEDFNGDRLPDAAVVNNSSKDIYVFLGNGRGGLSKSSELKAGDGCFAAYSADLDGDSKKDIVAVNHDSNDIFVFLGDGTGNFRYDRKISLRPRPHWVSGGDLNSDGFQDIAVPHWGEDEYISIILGGQKNSAGDLQESSQTSPEQSVWPQIYIGKYRDYNVTVTVHMDRTEVEAVFNADWGDAISVGIDHGSDGHFETFKMISKRDGEIDEKVIDMEEHERMMAETRAHSSSNVRVMSMPDEGVKMLREAKSSVMRNYGK